VITYRSLVDVPLRALRRTNEEADCNLLVIDDSGLRGSPRTQIAFRFVHAVFAVATALDRLWSEYGTMRHWILSDI
jgi:hypothetical protein